MVPVVKPHGTHLLREREASLYCAIILHIARVFSVLRDYCVSILLRESILGNVRSVLESTVLGVYSWQSTLYVDFMDSGHDNFT